MSPATPVFLVGRVLLTVGEILCCHMKLKDRDGPLRHMTGLVLDGLEHAVQGEGQWEGSRVATVISNYPHLLSLLAMLLNLDPTLEHVR